MAEKYFSKEEVDQLIPSLRPLFQEFLITQKNVEAVQDEYHTLYFQVANNGQNFESEKLKKLKERLDAEEKKLEELTKQIEGVGCEIKGVDPPLLDFPARIHGKKAYLCWRLDENEIQYWHDLESGYAGRQPIET